MICIHEDRADYLVGLQLTVLSLANHSPKLQIVISSPGANAEFFDWVDKQPNARITRFRHIQGSGWNIKPSVLLETLETYEDVVWIDSDIIITGDITPCVTGLDTAVLLATEETHWGQQQGGDFRTLAWGLRSGRALPCTINSGVLRVTKDHVPLLRAWQAMLVHPQYLKSQSQSWYARPLHMVGDQEALTGLLGATDFASTPIRLLRRGTDIAQCFGPAGYTPMERIRALFGGDPKFIHAMGPKPWLRKITPPAFFRRGDLVRGWRDWYQFLSLDTSPYCIAARRYRAHPELDLNWTSPRSCIGKVLSQLGGNRPAGPGLAVAIFDHGVRRLRQLFRISRYSQSPEFVLKDRPF